MALQIELKAIFELAASGGLLKEDIQSLVDEGICKKQQKQKKWNIVLIITISVAIVALVWAGVFGMKTLSDIKRDVFDLEDSSCFVDHSQASLEMSRPPSNCSTLCAGLSEVERLPSITQEEFMSKYAYTGRPLVITDATKNWSALQTFNYTFFKNIYRKHKGAMELSGEGGCQFFPYKTNLRGLKDVFRMSKKRAELRGRKWYIGWSNCDNKVMKLIRKHYQKPDFLPSDSESSQQDWMFMGGSGPGAPIHIDTVDRPSWQAQIKGKKSWMLIPPAECERVCYPLNITMNTGDIVVIDTNQWFHSTYIHPDGISITVGAEFD